MCDDENVEPIDDADIYRYFGDYPSGAGYVLFYQSVDLNLSELGLKRRQPRPAPASAPIPAIVQEHRERLVNIAEMDETSPRQGSTGAIPASPPVVSPSIPTVPTVPIIAPPVSPKVATTPVPKPVVSPPPVTPAVVNTTAPPPTVPRLNGNSAPTLAQMRAAPASAISPSLAVPNPKDKDGKWYQRRKSVDKVNEKRNSLLTSSAPSQTSSRPPTSASASSAQSVPFNSNGLKRQGTQNTFSSSTTGGTRFDDVRETEESPAAVQMPATRRLSNTQDSPANMSSSMVSNRSAMSSSSNSQSAAGSAGVGNSPTPASGGAIGVARQPSQNARQRIASTDSSSSGTTPGSYGADQGGSLTRRLSGMGKLGLGNKLTRSSSSSGFKMFGGKNRKDSGGMTGVQE